MWTFNVQYCNIWCENFNGGGGGNWGSTYQKICDRECLVILTAFFQLALTHWLSFLFSSHPITPLFEYFTTRFWQSLTKWPYFSFHQDLLEKVYFMSQILEHPSIGEYWNILSVPVLPENVVFTFFRMCWCYSEAYNTGTQKWSSIVQYSCISIWDFKFTFSDLFYFIFFFYF